MPCVWFTDSSSILCWNLLTLLQEYLLVPKKSRFAASDSVGDIIVIHQIIHSNVICSRGVRITFVIKKYCISVDNNISVIFLYVIVSLSNFRFHRFKRYIVCFPPSSTLFAFDLIILPRSLYFLICSKIGVSLFIYVLYL